MTTISATCKNCNKVEEAVVESSALFAYNQGELVQNAFPEMSPADREFYFKSGLCGDCFNAMFGFPL